jgi:hypothetical protein
MHVSLWVVMAIEHSQQVLMAVLAMSSDDVKAAAVAGNVIVVIEGWVASAAGLGGGDLALPAGAGPAAVAAAPRDPAARAQLLCEARACWLLV